MDRAGLAEHELMAVAGGAFSQNGFAMEPRIMATHAPPPAAHRGVAARPPALI